MKCLDLQRYIMFANLSFNIGVGGWVILPKQFARNLMKYPNLHRKDMFQMQ